MKKRLLKIYETPDGSLKITLETTHLKAKHECLIAYHLFSFTGEIFIDNKKIFHNLA